MLSQHREPIQSSDVKDGRVRYKNRGRRGRGWSVLGIAAAVVVAAIIVVALGLRHGSGPAAAGPSDSATAGSPTPSGAAVVSPTAFATDGGSPFALPSPTLSSPVPAWAHLKWSASSRIPDADIVVDIVTWKGQFIAAGRPAQAAGSNAELGVAFWQSADGSAWSRLTVNSAAFAHSQVYHTIATRSGLVAWGYTGQASCSGQGDAYTCGPMPVMFWTSPDGKKWTRTADTSMFNNATIVTVADGSLGLVAIGDAGLKKPAMWVSQTGEAWRRLDTSGDMFKDARFLDIRATASGYVIGGSTGDTPTPPGIMAYDNGNAVAWWFDGQDWHAGTVNGPGASLSRIYSGAQGMVAVGSAAGGNGRATWISTDGKSWQSIPVETSTAATVVGSVPSAMIGDDGTRMVAVGAWTHGAIRIWVSTDGSAWQEIAPSGATTTIPGANPKGAPAAMDGIWVSSDGFVITGQSGGPPYVPVWRVTAKL